MLLLKELIRLESLRQPSYNAYADEYCQKLNELKLKFIVPKEIKFKVISVYVAQVGGYECIVPELRSHDDKVYKILSESDVGLVSVFTYSPYTNQIRAWAQEYYDDQIAKINELVTSLRGS